MKSSTIITIIALLTRAVLGAAIPSPDVAPRWVTYITYDDVEDDSAAIEATKDRRWVTYITYDDVEEGAATEVTAAAT